MQVAINAKNFLLKTAHQIEMRWPDQNVLVLNHNILKSVQNQEEDLYRIIPDLNRYEISVLSRPTIDRNKRGRTETGWDGTN